MIGRARHKFENDRFRMGERITEVTTSGFKEALHKAKRQAIAGAIIVPVILVGSIGIWYACEPLSHWFVRSVLGMSEAEASNPMYQLPSHPFPDWDWFKWFRHHK